jgi:tRNA-Thr(GGU) m(6)t(6)A37 methyltransferase TsaA
MPQGDQMQENMGASFTIQPVGTIRKAREGTFIEIFPEYEEGLQGMEQFSHLLVLFWFHRNDTTEDRRTLKVHPRGNPANPLTGVFATRSPIRPNLIGIAVCRLVHIEGNVIQIDEIDAFAETPVLDLKPCLSSEEVAVDLKIAKWAEKESE